MISLEEACEKVIKPWEPYIAGISDVGYGYVIGTLLENGEVPMSAPVLIHKESGKIEGYFVPSHFDELDKAKTIEVPEKYAYKKA